MPARASLSDFYKTSSTSGTPVALGASSIKFHTLRLSGYKAADTANTENVKWRPVDGTGWNVIAPEGSDSITAPPGTYFSADQFEIDVEFNGDGFYVTYVSAVVYEGE